MFIYICDLFHTNIKIRVMSPMLTQGNWIVLTWLKSKGRTIRKLIGGGGGGRSTKKKYSHKGKLNEKKILARQLILKNIHAVA